jgi:hypothetical protein
MYSLLDLALATVLQVQSITLQEMFKAYRWWSKANVT